MTADFIRDFTAGMTHEQRLKQVRFIARLMDDQLALPGTNIRFELDSILGLFPGLGDALTSAISLLIVHHAWQSGASKLTLARMLGNVGVYFLVGSVPLVGDLFDVVFKANRRNARLLEGPSQQTSEGHGGDFAAVAPEAESVSYSAASRLVTSASVKTRLRVRKRTPSGASNEKPEPRPGTTSMISWVCFQ